jgi:hypothetical protein
MMARGVHKTAQTAFRLPDDVLSWLRGQAAKEDPATMTDIVVRALEAEREHCEGITTRVTTAPVDEPVSPPPRARRTAAKPTPAAKREPESAADIMAALRRRRTGGQ